MGILDRLFGQHGISEKKEGGKAARGDGRALARFIAALGTLAFLLLVLPAREAQAAPILITTIPVAGGGTLVANPTTNKIYVAQDPPFQVAVISGATNTVLATIPDFGFHGDLAADPVANRIYVPQSFAGIISVIDSVTDTVVANFPVPGLIHVVGTVGVIPAPFNRIYAVRQNNNDVAVLDGTSFALLAVIPYGPPSAPGCGAIPCNAQGIAVNPVTNRIYLGVTNSGTIVNSTVVMDGVTNTVVKTLPGSGPPGVPITNRIYIANPSANAVSVVDSATDTVVASISVPAPGHVAVNPATNRVYVISGSNLVVIDGNTNSIVATVPVGTGLGELAVIPSTSRIYVRTSGAVFVFEDPVTTPFAAFAAKAEIVLGPFANDDQFEVKATFTLGTGNNGINPVAEPVSLHVGTLSTTIPAGSFRQDKQGRFAFEGVIAGVALEAKILPLGGGSFAFKAQGSGADLTGTVNPVNVGLTIGNDAGGTAVTAEFL